MKNTTHRVVILKNVNSDLISQAILILKDSAIESDSNLMAEAERIVERYMNTRAVLPTKNKNKLTAGILSASIIVISITLLIIRSFV